MTGRTYPESEAPTVGFHGVSHHGEDPRRIAELSKANHYHVKMLAHLVGRLAATGDGDGTLLDHSLVLYGSNMGNSNQHVHYDVPHVLVGGANGKIKGGRHLAFPTKAVPTGNLLLSLLDTFDIHQDSIGDSEGRLVAVRAFDCRFPTPGSALLWAMVWTVLTGLLIADGGRVLQGAPTTKSIVSRRLRS